MSTALDEETLLREFLDEAVACESNPDADEHAAQVYVKISCKHCNNMVVWPTCMPHWNVLLVSFLINDVRLSCRVCDKEIVLLERSEIVGPVR